MALEVLSLCFFGIGALASAVTAVLYEPKKNVEGKPEQLPLDFERGYDKLPEQQGKPLAGHRR